MKNADVFENYDIVVAVAQEAVNRELTRLVNQGVIDRRIALIRELDADGGYLYTQLDSGERIPENAEYIEGKLLPRIEIQSSGTEVVLLLQVSEGSAAFWEGIGPYGTMRHYAIGAWQYGITVELDLAKYSNDADVVVPELVKAQLRAFEDSMFSVAYLFLDLASTALNEPQARSTRVDEDCEQALTPFIYFMAAYLEQQDETGNPYILGYSVHPVEGGDAPQSQYPVPDLLRPCGTTFNVFFDPECPGRSTINYVLVTAGGKKTVSKTPDNFETNWLQTDGHDGRMVLSRSVYAEPYILTPIFRQVRDDVYDSVKKNINVGKGNDYAAALEAIPNGWKYTIAADDDGKSRYWNSYTVATRAHDGAAELVFDGHVKVRKKKNKHIDWLFCTAKVTATSEVWWSGVVRVEPKTGADGQSVLRLTNQFQTDRTKNDTDKNKCARQADALDDFCDDIFGSLDLFGALDFWDDLLDDVFEVGIDEIGDIQIVTENLSSLLKFSVIMPAGSVYEFADVAFDEYGHIYVYVDYKK